ncbi:hypothetical protein HHI36_011095 [Cryptolaemus montrouzieri]|uniref:Polyprenal reductase n=1 Tax=Cryptolaemus montrouzieri TaxID=559131 RepID=A0ABD2MKT2_9CUCU
MEIVSLYLKRGEPSSINLIKFYFLLISIIVIFLGILVNFFEKYLPTFISKTFRYGKHACKVSTILPVLEFPKSSFRQFYKVGLLCMLVTYIFVVATYIFEISTPKCFKTILNLITQEDKERSELSATQVLVAITLLALQIARRYYDTHYVSIFGKNSKINFTHWGVGITYYPMVILAILCEAPNFSTPELRKATLSEIGVFEVIGISLFFWAWWHQHTCTVILASLRKTKIGNTDSYKLPMGDWFQYISSPHCTAEILMYVALSFFLWQSVTWWYVILWIFGNQIVTILLSHWWYQENFKNFPKNRKALIPYLY